MSPMSHENQCSLMGTAVNLDIFSSEFGFPVQKKTFFPLKWPAKEFDSYQVYERFAFMKSLEMQTLQQKDYELKLSMVLAVVTCGKTLKVFPGFSEECHYTLVSALDKILQEDYKFVKCHSLGLPISLITK